MSKKAKLWKARLIALVVCVILAVPIVGGGIIGPYRSHKIMTNHKVGSAQIINENWGGHGNYDYVFYADEMMYQGTSRRDYKHPTAGKAEPGDIVPVYFVKDNPKISLLYLPDFPFVAIPWFLIAGTIWTFSFIALIKPDSGWAMNFIDE